MTDALLPRALPGALPGILPRPGQPLARPRADAVPATARTAPARLDLRLPVHVGVFLGLSTAAYAVTLAGVTALESRTEADQAADRAPTLAGIDALAGRNQAAAAALANAGTDYQAAAAAYQAAGGRLADLERALSGLASSVQQINGVTTNLPTSVRLPAVRHVTSGGGAPATSATTGASGVP